MKNMSTFKIILLGVFGFFIMASVLIFANYRSSNSGAVNIGEVQIWGDVNEEMLRASINSMQIPELSGLTYTKIDGDFNSKLAEAIASGVGPDMILLRDDSILKHKSKIFPIPYDKFSQREFADKFLDEGQMLLFNDGIYGFPFMIDPLVMYYNKDILDSNGVAQSPSKWSQFFTLSRDISEVDNSLNITKSFVSFGEYVNVNNVKDILSMLIMQTGSDIISKTKDNLIQLDNNDENAISDVVRFYTEFSNPLKPTYSWNRSMKSSKQSFISSNLAVYFGFASELQDILSKNPNLNFDISIVPQADNGRFTTFGKMRSLSILKSSDNVSGSFAVAKILTQKDFIDNLGKYTFLPPVLRESLGSSPENKYQDIFNRSALVSKSWYDTDPVATNILFRELIENTLSGKNKISTSVDKFKKQLKSMVDAYNK